MKEALSQVHVVLALFEIHRFAETGSIIVITERVQDASTCLWLGLWLLDKIDSFLYPLELL